MSLLLIDLVRGVLAKSSQGSFYRYFDRWTVSVLGEEMVEKVDLDRGELHLPNGCHVIVPLQDAIQEDHLALVDTLGLVTLCQVVLTLSVVL